MVTKTSHIVIYDNNEHFLLENNKKLGGISLVGGKREEGETSIEAIIRETKEETGIEVIPENITKIIENEELYIENKHFMGDIYFLQLEQKITQNALETKKNSLFLLKFSELETLEQIFFGIPKDHLLEQLKLAKKYAK